MKRRTCEFIDNNESFFFAPFTFVYTYAHIRQRRVKNIADVIKIVRNAAAKRSTEELIEYFINDYTVYPPTEKELEILSILQQQYYGLSGAEEYAIITLWSCAIQSIIERDISSTSVGNLY